MTWLRRWDHLTLLGSVMFGLVAVSMLLDFSSGGAKWHLFWSLMPVLDLCIFLIGRSVSRRPGLQPKERRLWQALSLEGAVVMTGDGVQAALVWNGLDAPHVSPVTALCNLIGIMPMLFLLITWRTKDQSRPVRTRYLLDSAAVGIGFSVVNWLMLASTGTTDNNRTALLFGAMILGVTAFAGCNLVLAGVLPVTRPAAVMVAIGALLQTYGSGLLSSGRHLGPALAVLTVTSGLICLGVRVHQIDPDPYRFRDPNRRPYSVMPYGALLLGFALLPFSVESGIGVDFWIGVGGLFGTTVLVVVRQLLAFHENSQLLQEARSLQEQLRHQATHDALTGVANRALFDERLRATTGPSAVLLIDLDGFKEVNDRYGHHAGDMMLKAVAERLCRCVPENATAARLGGDEFAVILPGADAPAAQAVTDAFLTGLDEPMVVDGAILRARASVGLAAGTDAPALLRTADESMYSRKRSRQAGGRRQPIAS